MASLILLRHGQSTWNRENKFTGEVDVELTTLGEQEARFAGILLENYIIDIAFTSVLKRAVHTLAIILNEMGKKIPVIQNAALNERNYGNLQGLNKTDMELKYGVEKVLSWRRSYDIAPPNGESLKDTYNRVVPYYNTFVKPQLQEEKNILIVAHGNSLRALMMYLDDYSEIEIADINISSGIPRVYDFSPEMKLETANYLEE